MPSGATLNLNNLHLYVRGDQISGTVVGGTVTVVPSGGSIALETPTPGTLTPAGAVDDWTFYGTAGESITVQLNPGGRRFLPGRLAAPRLGSGRRCSIASSDVAGDGHQQRARVRSRRSAASTCRPAAPTRSRSRHPAADSSSTGNYVLSVYNVTPNVSSLTVNQTYTGTIGTAPME